MTTEKRVGGPVAGTAHLEGHAHEESLGRDSIQLGPTVSGQFREALDLATRAGLRMVRLRPGSNVPNLDRWPERATADPVALVAQAQESPDSNWGVLTGAGVGVLDFDTKSDPDGYGGYASMIDLEEAVDLSEWRPPKVRTASGEHWYFRYDGQLDSRVPWMPHLDLKADGGHQVAAPGTMREVDGREVRYELVSGDLSSIPRAPDALLDLMRTTRVRSTALTGSGAQRASGDLPTDDEALAEGLTAGDRNNTMHRLACRWWSRLGVGAQGEVLELARRVWEVTPGHDTFPWREVEVAVESARKYISTQREEDAAFIRAWEARRGTR